MKRLICAATLLALSSTALADKQADLAFEIKERHSYTQSFRGRWGRFTK